MDIIFYLENTIKNQIQTNLKNVATFFVSQEEGKSFGWFSIPMQILCFADYLGFLSFGIDGSTERSVQFIRNYFPQKYSEYAELLYSMWRHGTVHQFTPVCYYLELPGNNPNRINIVWLSNNSNIDDNRKEHLLFYSKENKENELFLVINIFEFIDDLLIALNSFIDELKNNAEKRSDCENRFNKCNEIQNCSEIKNKNCRKAVKDQILSAWNNRSGIADDKGCVKIRF